MIPADWIIELETQHTGHRASGWKFILTLEAGVKAFGDWAISAAADQLNVQPKTLANYLAVARSEVATLAQELGLSISHCQSVVGLPVEEARALLVKCAEDGESSGWLRHQARMARGIAAIMVAIRQPDPELPPHRTAFDDGATIHRSNGDDPHLGVPVMAIDPPVLSFTLSVLDNPDRTAFDVAEYLHSKLSDEFGPKFAKQVAEELRRWW